MYHNGKMGENRYSEVLYDTSMYIKEDIHKAVHCLMCENICIILLDVPYFIMTYMQFYGYRNLILLNFWNIKKIKFNLKP